jgi:ferrous iron transport protein B
MSTQIETVKNTANAACGACTGCNTAQLKRMGFNVTGWDFVVALAGNPNTGKSTIFNGLTGLRQHVGNWPGKTVVRAEGSFAYNDRKYKVVDLPGTYSLLSASADEEVARDFLLFGRPDVTIVVVDSTRLERNLNLALQVFEITDRVVIALNLMDEAKRHGIEVDARSLGRDLGVPVIPMAARKGEGMPDLLKSVEEVALDLFETRPRRVERLDPGIEKAMETLVAQIDSAYPGLPNTRWVALRLLEGDESIVRAVQEGTLGELSQSKAPISNRLIPVEAS